jgi:hypothetical protein
MLVQDIAVGMPFRFGDHPTIYMSHGNGWYGSPKGYDGGPWLDREQGVFPVPSKLNSFSFSGFSDIETLRLYHEMVETGKWGRGDMALMEHELSKRGLLYTPVTGPMRPYTIEEYNAR